VAELRQRAVLFYRIVDGEHSVPRGLNVGQLMICFFPDKVRSGTRPQPMKK
jgi:hypothetical protein